MKGDIRRLLLGFAVFLLSHRGFAISPEEVSNKLVCQCGCGLVLSNCNHVNCGLAIPMRKTIVEKIAQGDTEEQIVAFFVSSYGERVMSVPTKRGFNLVAWLLPFIGIATGAAFIMWVIRGWNRRHGGQLPGTSRETKTSNSRTNNNHYGVIFERELREFDEAGSK